METCGHDGCRLELVLWSGGIEQLFPDLPSDLARLVLMYCPAVAIGLPPNERLAVVRLVTTTTTTTATATTTATTTCIPQNRLPLMLEQLDVGNSDFNDPDMSMEEWIEGVRCCFSARALDALVCAGVLTRPLSIANQKPFHEYLKGALRRPDTPVDLFAALPAGSEADLLMLGVLHIMDFSVGQVVNPELALYFLQRLRDSHDPTFAPRRQQSLSKPPKGWFRFELETWTEDELLVAQLRDASDHDEIALSGWSWAPLFEALLRVSEPARNHLVQLEVRACVSKSRFENNLTLFKMLCVENRDGITAAYPSNGLRHGFTEDGEPVIECGTLTKRWLNPLPAPLHRMLIGGWLQQTRDCMEEMEDGNTHNDNNEPADVYSGLAEVFAQVATNPSVHQLLVDALPDAALATAFTTPAHEKTLRILVVQPSLPQRLVQCIPWNTWLRAVARGTDSIFAHKCQRADALLSFTPKKRVLLRQACGIEPR